MTEETQNVMDIIWEKLKEKAEKQDCYIDDNENIIVMKNQIWKKMRVNNKES